MDASASATAARMAVGRLRTQARQNDDALVATAAVHALARIPGPAADRALIEVIEAGRGSLPEHVAWMAALRSPSGQMLEPMLRILSRGRLAGMHAQATLARWATSDPWLIAASLRAALQSDMDVAGRRHVVETLGLVPDPSVAADLTALALDHTEHDAVRVAAIAALSDRSAKLPSAVARLARGDGAAADAARLAVRDAIIPRRAIGPGGLTVAQVHLGAQLDPDLERSGMGDTGGVATLLVKLGAALAETYGISRVLTIGRSNTKSTSQIPPNISDPDHQFESVPLAELEGSAFADLWPARIAARRGIARVFAKHGRPDVLHLRMADVGTLAAAEVAAAMAIPTVFSLAPDPHAVIAAREAAGSLNRITFAGEDADAHLWYRVDLVERLAAHARRLSCSRAPASQTRFEPWSAWTWRRSPTGSRWYPRGSTSATSDARLPPAGQLRPACRAQLRGAPR